MPVQLIGKIVSFSGKTLWEIVGNLKNFGVGRLIVKDYFDRYPEPSYYKILKVQPIVRPKLENMDRLVMVWAEHVFRGRKYSEPVLLYKGTYCAKFRLVPKAEEHKYLSHSAPERITVVPSIIEWPPLLKKLIEQDMKKQNKPGPVPLLRTKLTPSLQSVAVIDKADSVAPDVKPIMHAIDIPVAELQKEIGRLTPQEPQSATAS